MTESNKRVYRATFVVQVNVEAESVDEAQDLARNRLGDLSEKEAYLAELRLFGVWEDK